MSLLHRICASYKMQVSPLRAAAVPIATATQPRNWQRDDSVRGREIQGG